MNVSRLCMDGTMHPEEQLNKSQVYVTTAGYKNTFAYDKLIQLLVWMITEPQKAIVLGGTWKIPVLMGLQDRSFIQDQQRDGTYNPVAFEREYCSRWAGTTANAYFNGEWFDKNRVLKTAEYEHMKIKSADYYYVVSADIGRKGCESVACIFKVIPQPTGEAIKALVYIETKEDEHFENQAIWLKRLYYKYKARRLVIDGNGVGFGLVDYLVKPQIDPYTGNPLPDFGVYGGTQVDAAQEFKQYETPDCEQNALYILKANATVNTEAHTNALVQLSSGRAKFLQDEKTVKAKLLSTKMGQNMTPEERNSYLQPFVLTSILKEELVNLREEHEGINVILKTASKSLGKDKFSAWEYGLYYIRVEEEKKKKKKKFNAKDWKLYN